MNGETGSGTPQWMFRAACRGLDRDVLGDLFFPEHGTGQGSGAARQICATCAVRADCADYAIEHRIWHGIWGGLSTRSRRRIAADRERLAS